MPIGVDLGSSAVKVVELRRTVGGLSLVGVSRRCLPLPVKGAVLDPTDPRSPAARALREAVPNSGRARPAWIGLTGRDLNLQVLLFEQIPASNYLQLIQFEIEQRRESAPDHFIDYALTHEPDGQTPNYLTLIGSARSDWVEGRLTMARRAGLDPIEAVPNATALFSVYRHVVPNPGPETAAILDIGAENMELALVRGSELLFIRNVTSGARVFDEHIQASLKRASAEAEWLKVRHGTLGGSDGVDEGKAHELRPTLRSAAGQLAGVVQSTLNFARMQLQDRTLKIEKIYLSGGGARLRGFPEYLKGTLKVDIEILDPFQGIRIGSMASEVPGDLKQLPSDLTCAIGLALLSAGRGDTPVVSLMPDAIKKKRLFFRSTVFLVMAGIAALLLMTAMTVSAWMENRSVRSMREALETQVGKDLDANDQMAELEGWLSETSRKTRVLKQFADPGRILLDSLVRLRKGIPKGLTLRGMTMRPAGAENQPTPFGVALGAGLAPPGEMTLTIRGEVRSMEDLGAELERVAERLRGRGIRAQVGAVRPNPDRPGWRVFTINITFGGEDAP